MARGRPTKFKKDLIKDAELLAGMGFTEYNFATYWGISAETLRRWKRNTPDLCGAIKKGRLTANISVTKSAFNQAVRGNVTAIIFWLTNRCPEYWKNSRALINQVIGGEGDINVTTKTKNAEIRQLVSSWTPEEKKRFISVTRSLDKEFKEKRIGQIIKIEDEKEESEGKKEGLEGNQGVEEAPKEDLQAEGPGQNPQGDQKESQEPDQGFPETGQSPGSKDSK